MKSLRKNDKGFTLIEIVIVMAIAAALIVVVLIAVSGANKARRDTARKSDAARILAGIETCAGNHAGIISGVCDTMVLLNAGNYVSNPNDTTGVAYADTAKKGAPANAGDVSISSSTAGLSTFCDLSAISGKNQASVRIFTETGNPYCVDDK